MLRSYACRTLFLAPQAGSSGTCGAHKRGQRCSQWPILPPAPSCSACLQVSKSRLRYTWSSRAQQWELDTDCEPLPDVQCSILAPRVAMFPLIGRPDQQQQQQHMQLDLEVQITAPYDFKLVGWSNEMQGLRGAEAGSAGTLQLRAHTQGYFLPLEVLHLESSGNDGLARSAQVPCICVGREEVKDDRPSV